jgi:hypothetical protein
MKTEPVPRRSTGVVSTACGEGELLQEGKPGASGARVPTPSLGWRLAWVSERVIVCAEQRVVREGSSPSGARMRSAISKRGGNASRAGKRKQVWRSLNGHAGESRTQPRRTWSRSSQFSGGQGVHREVESEGHEEKYRAVIDGGHPDDKPVGQRWGKVEPAL